MGKVTGDITFTSHFKKFDQGEVIRNCEKMVRMYSRQVFQSIQVPSLVASVSTEEDSEDV